jgi:hypothetical protein
MVKMMKDNQMKQIKGSVRLAARGFVPTALVAFLALSSGCAQNKLRVKVQQVVLDDDDKSGCLQTDSRYGRAVVQTMARLEIFVEEFKRLGNVLNTVGTSDPPLRKLLAGDVQDLRRSIEACETLIEDLSGLFETDAIALAPRITAKLIRTRTLLKTTIQPQLGSIKNLANTSEDLFLDIAGRKTAKEAEKAMLDKFEAFRARITTGDINDLLDDVADATDEIVAVTDRGIAEFGFGGFATIGVFEINAADPIYRKILKRPVLTREEFTQASANIGGDSSIMLVMESPGQTRVYQVQNDPTQLVRNIAILIQKATAAATKILSSFVVPGA